MVANVEVVGGEVPCDAHRRRLSGRRRRCQRGRGLLRSRNGLMHAAYPTFIDGTALPVDGRVKVVNRRRELARLITRSDDLGRALVNRLWAHFLGYGFSKPFDDLGPHNRPVASRVVERLASEFVGQGYDLKRLTRWIVLSESYALSSKFGSKLGNAGDDPQTGTPPLFSHFYVRQMLPEQLYDSLLVATDGIWPRRRMPSSNDSKTMDASIYHCLRHRRKRRGDHLRRHHYASLGDDEWRSHTAGRQRPVGQLPGGTSAKKPAVRGVWRPRQSRRADTITNFIGPPLAPVPSREGVRVAGGYLTALSATPPRVARHLVGSIEQQRVYFESLTGKLETSKP